jgi:hypothetical protein
VRLFVLAEISRRPRFVLKEHAGEHSSTRSLAMPLEIVVGAVVGAAAVSAAQSETVRNKMRKGAVYSLAGLLMAYDKVAALTKGAVDGARQFVKEADEQRVAPASAATTNRAANNGSSNNGAVKTPASTTAAPSA